MPEHLKEIEEYITSLLSARNKYVKVAPGQIWEFYGGQDGIKKRPERFKESSYLYIRSYNGDMGSRPFSGQVFWNSPDINISPITNIGSYTTSLEAGKTYNINVRLHNRGDLTVPFPKVEFFLTDPTLGFDTRFAKYLGVTQLPGLLLAATNDALNFQYNVSPTESGHKCLFVRTFSFSPLDKPVDIYALNPTIDRHIGQKNLNFVAQATAYSFNLIHQPNTLETIEFMPLSRAKVEALQHPSLNDFKIGNMASREAFANIRIEPVEKQAGDFELRPMKTGFQLSFKGGDGFSVDRQAAFMKEFNAVLKSINAGKTKAAAHKELFAAFREMNKPLQKTAFQMLVPDFKLKKGQAAGFDIVNRNLVTNEIKGGITIIAMG